MRSDRAEVDEGTALRVVAVVNCVEAFDRAGVGEGPAAGEADATLRADHEATAARACADQRPGIAAGAQSPAETSRIADSADRCPALVGERRNHAAKRRTTVAGASIGDRAAV